MRTPLDVGEIVSDLEERSAIAVEHNHRAGAEDGVDSTAFEAELAQVGAAEERFSVAKSFGRCRPGTHGSVSWGLTTPGAATVAVSVAGVVMVSPL